MSLEIHIWMACNTSESLLNKRSVSDSKQSTNKHLMANGTAFRKFYCCYNDIVCRISLPLGQMQSDMFHIRITKPFLTHWSWVWFVQFTWTKIRAHDVTGRKEMLTPSKHLIPPPIYPDVHGCPILNLCIFNRFYETDDFDIYAISWHEYII
jgi:hypothetical protein